MRAEIVATGDEIRTGSLVDSNSAYIAEQLEQEGIEVTRHHAVGDDLPMLVGLLHEIAGRAEVAVVTGGLGPTEDDLTTAAAARALGVDLALDEQALEEVRAYFEQRGRIMPPSNWKQALLPRGVERLSNPIGTAPGFCMLMGGCAFFFLPGVPHEMRRMLQEQVLTRLRAMRGETRAFRLTRVISTFGLPESKVGERMAAIHSPFPSIKLGLRAKFPEIQVKLYLNTTDETEGRRLLEKATEWVSEQLGIHVFSYEERTLAEEVGMLLKQYGFTLALAESCTGGLISNWLTNTPGSSDYFLFGAVTYSNESKMRVLGVSPETLDHYGAVHEETVREMAQGARRVAGATYGLATSGIAGPHGGTPEKPVGTLCIGVDGPQGTRSRTVTLSFGQRVMNRKLFAMAALDLLRRALLEGANRP